MVVCHYHHHVIPWMDYLLNVDSWSSGWDQLVMAWYVCWVPWLMMFLLLTVIVMLDTSVVECHFWSILQQTSQNFFDDGDDDLYFHEKTTPMGHQSFTMTQNCVELEVVDHRLYNWRGAYVFFCEEGGQPHLWVTLCGTRYKTFKGHGDGNRWVERVVHYWICA